MLPENADGENYRYNWSKLMTSQVGTGVLDPETDSIAQDAEHGDDEEEDGGEDDDEDVSGDSEGVPQLAGLMEKLAGLDRQGTLDMLDVLRDY